MSLYAVHPSSLNGDGGARLLSPLMATANRPEERRALPPDHVFWFVVKCLTCPIETAVFVDRSGGAGVYPRSVMAMAAEALARRDHGDQAPEHQLLTPRLEPRMDAFEQVMTAVGKAWLAGELPAEVTISTAHFRDLKRQVQNLVALAGTEGHQLTLEGKTVEVSLAVADENTVSLGIDGRTIPITAGLFLERDDIRLTTATQNQLTAGPAQESR